jgi:hypothetical protein
MREHAVRFKSDVMEQLFKCILLFSTLLLSLSMTVNSFAASLLPSQEDPNVYAVSICQDRRVLSLIKSSIDRVLQTKTIIAKGMQADDIHLEAVFTTKGSVVCSMTVQAKGVSESVSYVIGPNDGSYLIVFGGDKGSKLFPESLRLRPIP